MFLRSTPLKFKRHVQIGFSPWLFSFGIEFFSGLVLFHFVRILHRVELEYKEYF